MRSGGLVREAPRAGLEPATIRLHVLPPFPAGVDYLITLSPAGDVGGGRSRGAYSFVTP